MHNTQKGFVIINLPTAIGFLHQCTWDVSQNGSISKTGASLIYVNIQEGYKKMRPTLDDLRCKVERAKSQLPESIIGPFVNDEFGDVFGMVMTLTGEGYSYAELKEVADEVQDELLLLKDVAKVDIYGRQAERIFVEYNNARLADEWLKKEMKRWAIGYRYKPGSEIETSGKVNRSILNTTIIDLVAGPSITRINTRMQSTT